MLVLADQFPYFKMRCNFFKHHLERSRTKIRGRYADFHRSINDEVVINYLYEYCVKFQFDDNLFIFLTGRAQYIGYSLKLLKSEPTYFLFRFSTSGTFHVINL